MDFENVKICVCAYPQVHIWQMHFSSAFLESAELGLSDFEASIFMVSILFLYNNSKYIFLLLIQVN